MTPQFKNLPFYLQFKFTAAAEGSVNTAQIFVPFNMAVYAITVSSSVNFETGFYNYTLDFLNYDTGDVLFDEPIQGYNIQTDARTPWRLPSKWFLNKADKIICSLNVFDATFSSSIDTCTYYVTLLCHLTEVDPNPGVQPFVYSFRQAVGWQDEVQDAGSTSVSMNQQLTGSVAKQAKEEFELRSIILDAWSEDPYFLHLPILSFQVTAAGKKLFDRMVIDGVAGGGNDYNQGNTSATSSTRGFPRDNNLQYILPAPVRVPKHCMMRVDFSPAPTYLASDSIHSILNQQCCMALIGNHYAT